jgi:hypothetical protein
LPAATTFFVNGAQTAQIARDVPTLGTQIMLNVWSDGGACVPCPAYYLYLTLTLMLVTQVDRRPAYAGRGRRVRVRAPLLQLDDLGREDVRHAVLRRRLRPCVLNLNTSKKCTLLNIDEYTNCTLLLKTNECIVLCLYAPYMLL